MFFASLFLIGELRGESYGLEYIAFLLLILLIPFLGMAALFLLVKMSYVPELVVKFIRRTYNILKQKA